MAKYKVECSSKPDIFFDEIPENVYWCEGLQNPDDKNKGCWFHFDNGTCLAPIIEIETGKQITKPN
jgi:hypothetical protein